MAIGPSHSVLPQRVDPLRFAQHGVKLDAQLSADKLIRLASAVHAVPGDVWADLQFLVDESRRRVVQGELTAGVEVICQRCMQAMNLDLQVSLNLAVVVSEEQAKLLPEEYEPWLIDAELNQSDLYEILEEELLLALPIVALHEHACIDADAYKSTDTALSKANKKAKAKKPKTGKSEKRISDVREESEGLEVRDNPFRVLEQLKSEPTKEN